MLATKRCRIHILLGGFHKQSWGCALLWSQQPSLYRPVQNTWVSSAPLGARLLHFPPPRRSPHCACLLILPHDLWTPTCLTKPHCQELLRAPRYSCFLLLMQTQAQISGWKTSKHPSLYTTQKGSPSSEHWEFCYNPALSLPFHCHILQAFPNGKAHKLPALFYPLLCFS